MPQLDVTRLSDIQQKNLLLELASVIAKRYNTTPRAVVGKLFEESMSDVCSRLIAPSKISASSRGGDFSVGRHRAVESKQTHITKIVQRKKLAAGQLYHKPYFNISDWESMVTSRDGYAFGMVSDEGGVIAALVALGPKQAEAVSSMLCESAGVLTPADAETDLSGRTHIMVPLRDFVTCLKGRGVYYVHRNRLVTRAQFLTLFGLLDT